MALDNCYVKSAREKKEMEIKVGEKFYGKGTKMAVRVVGIGGITGPGTLQLKGFFGESCHAYADSFLENFESANRPYLKCNC
jgi:hypothetical protein